MAYPRMKTRTCSTSRLRRPRPTVAAQHPRRQLPDEEPRGSAEAHGRRYYGWLTPRPVHSLCPCLCTLRAHLHTVPARQRRSCMSALNPGNVERTHPPHRSVLSG
jgi:hypothetical protein